MADAQQQMPRKVADLHRSKYTRVLVLYTGGTIGMKSSPDGFIPAKGYINTVLTDLAPFHDKAFGDPAAADSASLPDFVTPESKFGKRCVYHVLEYDPLLDSCNMSASDWAKIAHDIEKYYADYDAFIVVHGTDTMAYTASALSFMLSNLSKTVIVTGSQVPLSIPLNDGIGNFLGALTVATHFEIPEVLLYFNSNGFRGNRTIKGDASNFDAFKSPNCEALVRIGVDYTVDWNRLIPAPTEELVVQSNFSPDIAVFRLFPGFSVASLKNLMQAPLKGLVLQTFGAGNAPDSNVALIDALTEASARGLVIVNVTQCTQGSVEAHYATGVVLQRAGVVPGHDMTVEAALTKLGYLLGLDLEVEEVRRRMLLSLRGELTENTGSTRFSFKDESFINSVYQALQNSSSDAGVDNAAAEKKALISDALRPVLMCSAAAQGLLAEVKRMVDDGCQANIADYDKRTPMHLAAAEGHTDVIKFLIEAGASTTVKDAFGVTPLMEAAKNEHDSAAALLREHGARLGLSAIDAAHHLLNAVAANQINTVRRLLENGGKEMATAMDYDNRTALHIAASSPHNTLELVRLLLDHGADVNQTDRFGNTAASEADRYKHEEVGKLLAGSVKGADQPTPTRPNEARKTLTSPKEDQISRATSAN